ncbi:MAG TPA: hypothetical protein VEH56_04815, partial [Candidatus Saccharimonadales bacterium]|nr:hypothetical protein [Candidatus Saccharimonadales bacterium]
FVQEHLGWNYPSPFGGHFNNTIRRHLISLMLLRTICLLTLSIGSARLPSGTDSGSLTKDLVGAILSLRELARLQSQVRAAPYQI